MVILMLVVLIANRVINHVYQPIPVPVSTNEVAQVTNIAGTNATGTNAANANTASSFASAISEAVSGTTFVVNAQVPEDLLVVSNEVARYTFTSRGGGLKMVELLKYPETVSALRLQHPRTNAVASLNTASAPPVLALVGNPAMQDDGVFKLTAIPGGVRAEKTLTNGLTITKDFLIGSNYLITATVKLQNQSQQTVAVPAQEWVAGTATPMGPQDNALYETVMWYNGASASSVAASYFNTNTTSLFGLMSRTPQTIYNGGSNNVAWVSAQNQFFTIATMAATNRPAQALAVRAVELPRPSDEEIQASSRTVRRPVGLEAVLAYSGVTLKPGETSELSFNVFAGPKKYETVRRLEDQFNNRIDLVMGFGGWYGPISKALLVTMIWLNDAVKLPFGLIVVLITVVLKMLFWPLTRASTRSMKRMQELQPQMKALQAKYKDDPAKLQSKTWEFYKKNKVNPLGGCLPMLLQIPIFFGFFGMLRNAIELRGAHFLWINDLSQPDTLFIVPGFNFPINPMPLLMAGAQFWQASLTPPSPGMDPAQQKMMRYMPLLMVFIFYGYPSGLALYWTVSTLLTVLQTKLTKTQTPATAAVPAPARPPQKKNH